jgi:hypothetical protein
MQKLPELTMEDRLQKERIKRMLNKLYDEGNINDMHEAAYMLLETMYQHKIAMYYFKNEAVNNLAAGNQLA